MTDNKCYMATPDETLEAQFMNCNTPLSEREHWARNEIERLREGLALIECEPINAEYMARNILDGKPAYYDTMIKVCSGDTAIQELGEYSDKMLCDMSATYILNSRG